MFKEIGAIMGLLSVPHNNVLKLDKVANINGDDLTLTIASYALEYIDYQKLKINREIERAIQKEEELRKETEKHGTCE